MTETKNTTLGTPLAIAPHKYEASLAMLLGAMFSATEYTVDEGVAVIPIDGPIYSVAKYWSIVTASKAADADETVTSIRYDINSPGGLVAGCIQAARDIEAIKKPTTARVVGDACSAAYLLASAADTIEASPTGIVGSIGCILRMYKEGDDTHTLKFVSNVSPDKQANPESAEGSAQYQQLVDDGGAAFVAEVARMRGTDPEFVRLNYGGGLIMSAGRALEHGMIDSILTVEGESTMAEDKTAEEMEPKTDETEEELKSEETSEEETEEKPADDAEETPEEEAAEEETEEMTDEEKIAELEKKVADLEKQLEEKDSDEDESEEEEVEEEAKSEEKAEASAAPVVEDAATVALKAELEAMRKQTYEANRAVAIEKLKAEGRLKPAEEALAINAYNGEKSGEHKLFTEYFASRDPVVALNHRQSHNASTEEQASGEDSRPSMHDRVILECKASGLNHKNPVDYRTALNKVLR